MKTLSPSVSIIIPVYNSEKYLTKCLDSVVNQTLKDIEVFCIDDGSTDNSWEIIQGYAKHDKRIVAIQQKNKGAAVARNKGLERANGEYIGFVDSDDYVSKDYFEKLYKTAKSKTADISVAYVKADIDNVGNSQYIQWIKNDVQAYEDMYNKERKEAVKENKLNLHSVIWLAIYKKKLLQKYSIKFYPELRTGQDNVFLAEVSYYANRVVYTTKPTYYHRVVRGGSLMSEYNFTDNGLLSRTSVLWRVVDFLNSKPDYNSEVYRKRVASNLNFLQGRLNHAKSRKTIFIITNKLTTLWKNIKYKEDIQKDIDQIFAQSLTSRYKMFMYIYKLSHPHSRVRKIKQQTKRVIKPILPYGVVIVRRKLKSKHENKGE